MLYTPQIRLILTHRRMEKGIKKARDKLLTEQK